MKQNRTMYSHPNWKESNIPPSTRTIQAGCSGLCHTMQRPHAQGEPIQLAKGRAGIRTREWLQCPCSWPFGNGRLCRLISSCTTFTYWISLVFAAPHPPHSAELEIFTRKAQPGWKWETPTINMVTNNLMLNDLKNKTQNGWLFFSYSVRGFDRIILANSNIVLSMC